MVIDLFSHVGITVTDLDESRRFFVEGLGFEPVLDDDGRAFRFSAGGDYGRLIARLNELDAELVGDLESFQRDGKRILLVNYHSPVPQRQGRRNSAICGLSHLCFNVSDIDVAAARLEALGGTALRHTRITTDLPDGVEREYMICLDPDGAVKLELVRVSSSSFGNWGARDE